MEKFLFTLPIAILVLVLFSNQNAYAAMDMFLKIDGIDGESQDAAHKNQIDVLAWSWGVSNSGSIGAGGTGTGKANFQGISLTKFIDKASPPILEGVASGKHYKTVELSIRNVGSGIEPPLEFVKYRLSDVIFTSQSSGGSSGEDRLTENISFIFTKIESTYVIRNADGTCKSFSAGWDIAQNKAFPPSTLINCGPITPPPPPPSGDTEPPVLSQPNDITVVATSLDGAMVSYALPTATDNVDPAPTVTCSQSPDSEFPIGATIVTCDASDSSGNTSSVSFVVTVLDTITPGLDPDLDGITNEVDPTPATPSNSFDDESSPIATTGSIVSRGDQLLTIHDSSEPLEGVVISADPAGGTTSALVSLCSDASNISLSAGDQVVVTCGSVTIKVISGSVEVEFVASDGTTGTTTLDAGDNVTFDQDTADIFNNGSEPVIVEINGNPIAITPGVTFVITDPTTITINKIVSGGTLAANDFGLFITTSDSIQIPVTNGLAEAVLPGTYQISETAKSNYIPSYSGNCVDDPLNASRRTQIESLLAKNIALQNAITENPTDPNTSSRQSQIDANLEKIAALQTALHATMTIQEGDELTCTITNTFVTPSTVYLFCDDMTLNELLDLAGSGTYKLIDNRDGHLKQEIKGTDGNDLILASASGNTIKGKKGNDCIIGGAGNDKLLGGKGNDQIFGQGGNDKIYGNQDKDKISGGNGDDNLWGGIGDDIVYGGNGNDKIFGMPGIDILLGGLGDDKIHGGQGDDTLNGGEGTGDICQGGQGKNIFIGCEKQKPIEEEAEEEE